MNGERIKSIEQDMTKKQREKTIEDLQVMFPDCEVTFVNDILTIETIDEPAGEHDRKVTLLKVEFGRFSCLEIDNISSFKNVKIRLKDRASLFIYKSNIEDTRITITESAYMAEIKRSTIINSAFTVHDTNSRSHIQESVIIDSDIHNGRIDVSSIYRSYLDRSVITCCSVNTATIDYCKLVNSFINIHLENKSNVLHPIYNVDEIHNTEMKVKDLPGSPYCVPVNVNAIHIAQTGETRPVTAVRLPTGCVQFEVGCQHMIPVDQFIGRIAETISFSSRTTFMHSLFKLLNQMNVTKIEWLGGKLVDTDNLKLIDCNWCLTDNKEAHTLLGKQIRHWSIMYAEQQHYRGDDKMWFFINTLHRMMAKQTIAYKDEILDKSTKIDIMHRIESRLAEYKHRATYLQLIDVIYNLLPLNIGEC